MPTGRIKRKKILCFRGTEARLNKESEARVSEQEVNELVASTVIQEAGRVAAEFHQTEVGYSSFVG